MSVARLSMVVDPRDENPGTTRTARMRIQAYRGQAGLPPESGVGGNLTGQGRTFPCSSGEGGGEGGQEEEEGGGFGGGGGG